MGLLTILKLLVDEVDDGARGDGPLSPKVKTPEEGWQLCPVHRGQILWDFPSLK